jgi:wyosine [tRNA(Phe)-imidazoG37] synthetase (radical SAM superfamily)
MNQTQVDSSDVVFGPVPSRRLGMSLGIDVIPMKICSYDCIYCELGKTTHRTIERKEYISETTVIRALEDYFGEKHENQPDYVTFSGSGEPTLNSGIGRMIRAAKQLTDIPVAVLTNGSLLYDPAVRRDLMAADLVVPSLDAVEQKAFIKVNQPVHGLDVADVTDGILQFSKGFPGTIWLEILLVKGVNDHPGHLRQLAETARRINPAKIQLTTVVRPPGHGSAPAVDRDRLNEIARLFDGPVEVVGDFDRRENPGYRQEKRSMIEAMLRIRPMTLEDISASTGMHRNEIIKYLDQIRSEHTVHTTTFEGKTYFTIDR